MGKGIFLHCDLHRFWTMLDMTEPILERNARFARPNPPYSALAFRIANALLHHSDLGGQQCKVVGFSVHDPAAFQETKCV